MCSMHMKNEGSALYSRRAGLGVMLPWNLRPWKLEQRTPKEPALSARESITAIQSKRFLFLRTGGLDQIDCFVLYLFICHQLVAMASLDEFTFG